MTGSINNEHPSFPNVIKFQLGKRKKELFSSERDECIIGNADEGRTDGNGTPTGNKKIKLLKVKMSPASLQPNAGVQSYKTNARIFGIKDAIHLRGSDADNGTENCMNKKEVDVGRSLDMLVDAIQLIEGQRLHIIVEQQGQEKDLIAVLPENIMEDLRPSLQDQQFRANDCLEDSNKVVLDGEPSDAGYNCKGISKAVDIDSRTMLRTRSRGGWLPTLPSKYSDSVLQPWKKVTRKCPNILEGKGAQC
ncbi:hypothetical protein SUGI_0997080 [Cryptomeria japonica]|nr:hypothetical protein SUGI_0997080 [Cryptomeria japonica]